MALDYHGGDCRGGFSDELTTGGAVHLDCQYSSDWNYFFESAQFMRKHSVFEQISGRKQYIILSAALLCSTACTMFNGTVDLLYKRFGSIPLFLLGAWSGIILIVSISMMLEKTTPLKRVFLYLGKNTLLLIFSTITPVICLQKHCITNCSALFTAKTSSQVMRRAFFTRRQFFCC